MSDLAEHWKKYDDESLRIINSFPTNPDGTIKGFRPSGTENMSQDEYDNALAKARSITYPGYKKIWKSDKKKATFPQALKTTTTSSSPSSQSLAHILHFEDEDKKGNTPIATSPSLPMVPTSSSPIASSPAASSPSYQFKRISNHNHKKPSIYNQFVKKEMKSLSSTHISPQKRMIIVAKRWKKEKKEKEKKKREKEREKEKKKREKEKEKKKKEKR